MNFLTGVVDPDREILLNLSAKDLSRACKTNKYAGELCANEEFLLLRLELIYKGNYNEALVDAATHGDFPFVQYLVQNYEVDFDYDNDEYYAFWDAFKNGHTTILRYLIENLNITTVDLNFILFIALRTDLDLDGVKYIIEKTNIIGAVIKNDKNPDISATIKIAKIWNMDEAVHYLNMLDYLYETLEQSIYLKALKDLSKSKGEYQGPWVQ